MRITDEYSIHRVVINLFEKTRENENESSGVLYADKGGDAMSRKILIISDRDPVRTDNVKTIDIPDSFLEHAHYRFEILVNPCYRDNQNRKLVAIRDDQAILDWFEKKAQLSGFSIDKEALDISQKGLVQFSKKSQKVSLNKALIKGDLTVTDEDLFKKSCSQGIGRAKAFGFGLLQLAINP